MKNIYNIVDVRSLLFVFGIENAGDEISENKSAPIFLLAFRTRSDAMLMWPEFNLPFTPTLSYWLGEVSTFDREETLGAQLRVFNPNDTNDREKIIRSYVLARFEGLTYRHRFLLFEILEGFLSLPDFDFATEFEADYDANESVAWDETEIANPRGFFEENYRLASEEWKDDLQKARLEDRSAW